MHNLILSQVPFHVAYFPSIHFQRQIIELVELFSTLIILSINNETDGIHSGEEVEEEKSELNQINKIIITLIPGFKPGQNPA